MDYLNMSIRLNKEKLIEKSIVYCRGESAETFLLYCTFCKILDLQYLIAH